MPDWLKEWWPIIAFVSPFVVAGALWAIRMGLPSRQEVTKGLQAEASARTAALVELDERLSNALAAIDKKVLSLEAEIKHLPTADDFAELKTQMARVETRAIGTEKNTENIRASVNRIEDYLLKRGNGS